MVDWKGDFLQCYHSESCSHCSSHLFQSKEQARNFYMHSILNYSWPNFLVRKAFLRQILSHKVFYLITKKCYLVHSTVRWWMQLSETFFLWKVLPCGLNDSGANTANSAHWPDTESPYNMYMDFATWKNNPIKILIL